MHTFDLIFVISDHQKLSREKLLDLIVGNHHLKQVLSKILFREIEGSVTVKPKIGIRLVKCPITFDLHIKTLKRLLDEYSSDEESRSLISDQYKEITDSMFKRISNNDLAPSYTLEKTQIAKGENNFISLKINYEAPALIKESTSGIQKLY